ncbi:E1-like protein-activating [Marasmius fiardii PR-910]|nr:E1-like protein-activating [Marasmius fiardii PR-910]
MAPTIVQFTPLPSLTHPSFWHKLTELKLDVLKLSDAEVDITGTYGVGRLFRDREASGDSWVGVGGSLGVDEDSLGKGQSSVPLGSAVARGIVKNFNTIEDFKAVDKSKLFNQVADKIWVSIQSTRSTALLNSFLVITYADLKKYKFFYWFAFPAFVSKPAWYIDDKPGWVSAASDGIYSNEQLKSILDQLHKSANSKPLPYFLVRSSGNATTVAPVEEYNPSKDTLESTTIGFIDPSAGLQNPGWPLRNLLAYMRVLFPDTTKKLRVLCWRDSEIPRSEDGWKSRFGVVTVGDGMAAVEVKDGRPDAVGWEKNVQGKLSPRVADLAPMMDPTRLANQAVDLNLKLMRWRIIPALDLEKIAATKCLLLGAGTLGCYVARCLMGWGVRKITLVDSARVSFSNPVRQPLFQFSDCLNGGQPKAECAANRLKEVWPGLDATGISLSIPMPGHPIPESPPSIMEQTRKDVERLEQLIEEHDAIYLLMDSRESRWLPTVIGRAKGKLVLNAALGFDTFLVMRHGARPEKGATPPPEDPKGPRRHLGCYYCNDIVAPADSLSDRTLDQMCTVTRPGLASIASSTAVELMMSVIQHPDGLRAPAPPPQINPNDYPAEGEGTSVLGLIPHQLRGYLAQFRNLPIVGAAYDKCTGCSETVLQAYEREGFDMMVKAFNDPKYLEKLTGLDKLYDDSEKALEDVDWAEGGEEDGDDF